MFNTWRFMFSAVDIGDILPTFRGMHRDIVSTPCWVNMGEITVRANPETDSSYGPEPSKPDPPKPHVADGEGQQQQETQDDGKVKGRWLVKRGEAGYSAPTIIEKWSPHAYFANLDK